MNIYIAPKPTYTVFQWVKSILARLFFPPILFWDLLKLGVNQLVGQSVSELVLPAQTQTFRGRQSIDELNENEDLFYEEHLVITHDGAELDTIEMMPKYQTEIASNDRKYVVNFVGNNKAFEQIMGEMQQDANDLNRVVIGFNLRGVSRSTGQAISKDDLITDGIAQVQRLLDDGVPSQHITLKAYSLGAAIASLVAHHFHQQNQRINVFNNRSFSSITNFIVGRIRVGDTGTGHDESFGRKLLGWLAKPFVKLGVSLANWEINAADAFQEIPNEYREYICVRTEKNLRTDNVKDDSLITHYASIHASLKSERTLQKEELDYLIEGTAHAATYGQLLSQEKIKESLKCLTAARDTFKDRKMQTALKSSGHSVLLASLTNRSGHTGKQFFSAFIERVDTLPVNGMNNGFAAKIFLDHEQSYFGRFYAASP